MSWLCNAGGRCNTRGGGVRGQCDQGRSGLEAESPPCCQDVTKWDACLQSRPFGQNGPVIQHVAKYLLNSSCLNFQETKPKGSRERPVSKRLQQLNHGMCHYMSHKEAVLVPLSMCCVCFFVFFFFFYTQFCCFAPQAGFVRGLVELCFHVKAISCVEGFQMNLLHYVKHVCTRFYYVLESSETLWTTVKWEELF